MSHAICILVILFIYQSWFSISMRMTLLKRVSEATQQELTAALKKSVSCICFGLFAQFLALAILPSSLVVYMKYLK